MPVRMSIDKHKVEAKITNAWKAGLPQLCEEILNSCNQYCKWDKGTLEESSKIHSRPQEGLLIWQTPYARRQYWEIRTAYKDYNPNATWKWCEVAKSKHRAQWECQAQRALEMNL